jgi:uncharacterized membrane protein
VVDRVKVNFVFRHVKVNDDDDHEICKMQIEQETNGVTMTIIKRLKNPLSR